MQIKDFSEMSKIPGEKYPNKIPVLRGVSFLKTVKNLKPLIPQNGGIKNVYILFFHIWIGDINYFNDKYSDVAKNKRNGSGCPPIGGGEYHDIYCCEEN